MVGWPFPDPCTLSLRLPVALRGEPSALAPRALILMGTEADSGDPWVSTRESTGLKIC